MTDCTSKADTTLSIYTKRETQKGTDLIPGGIWTRGRIRVGLSIFILCCRTYSKSPDDHKLSPFRYAVLQCTFFFLFIFGFFGCFLLVPSQEVDS